MRRTLLLLAVFLLGIPFTLSAQIGVGQWRAHFAAHDATRVAQLGNDIYVLSDGSLYSYSPLDDALRTLDKTTLLNDCGIRFMRYCGPCNTLCLIYDNADIDLLTLDDNVYNMPDFAQSTSYDPTVNDVTVNGTMAYLATTFGIVAVNLARREFTATWPLKAGVLSCASDGRRILAATAEGLFCGRLSDNLLDPASWQCVSPAVFAHIESLEGIFVGQAADGSLSVFDDTFATTPLCAGSFSFMHLNENVLVAATNDKLYLWESPRKAPAIIATDVPFADALPEAFPDGKTLWAACGTHGLRGYELNNNSLTLTVSDIIPDSPVRNHCDYISFTPDERLLVAGGCLNYFGTTFYPGTIEIYDEGTWTTFQEEGIAEATGLKLGYNNVTSIVQDPLDPTHHFASSYGQGIYEFRDGKYVRCLNSSNSILETAVPDAAFYTRISRLQYDATGNLWMTNSHALSPLKVMTPDGDIVDVPYDELREQPTVTDILFASSGLTYVVVMRADAGLFCIDPAGTPLNPADDRTRFISPRFNDQYGGSTTIDYLCDIAEDRDGTIWLLTNQGPFLIPAGADFFSPSFTFNKIKVPRNDGSGYADYLLEGVYTTTIAIDPAGRKWIGTLSSGIYLISADGLQTIHHFTTADSPLPSDCIRDIAVCGSTGEVFIATDRGLVSFRSDATTPDTSYTPPTDIHVFPNPVTPDYDGPITINGLMADSPVRILSTAGHVVAAGTSQGGSFTWDGRDLRGQRVPTGVYSLLATDPDGHQGIATNIVIAR